MSYLITKEFTFSASHWLEGLPTTHQCARLHGHNYTVIVQLEAAELDSTGFVVDYGDLAPFKDWLDNTLDHRHLNDMMTFNPTAEHLATYLTRVVTRVLDIPDTVAVAIGVSETPKTWAWYRCAPHTAPLVLA